MADGNEPNLDRAQIVPAVQTNDHDPFADARMGARFQQVSYQDTQGMPSCQQILDTVHQLDQHGPNLVGRMDQFVGGTLAKSGVTFDQLKQMENSPQFSQQDKAAIAVMMNGFAHATNTKVDSPHMTMQQFAVYLIRSGVQEQCQVPQR
jgi:hypothetical protein